MAGFKNTWRKHNSPSYVWTDELVTKVLWQRNGSLSLRCGRWINDLMLSMYRLFPDRRVESIFRSQINTEIIEQSWFVPILPEWRCFMDPMVYTPICIDDFSAPHNAQNTPRCVTSFNVDNMHFPLTIILPRPALNEVNHSAPDTRGSHVKT